MILKKFKLSSISGDASFRKFYRKFDPKKKLSTIIVVSNICHFTSKEQTAVGNGELECFVFQDIIDRKYVFALCSDLNKEVLHTRVHSSCLTSETMLSLDCDCKDQLYGAVEKTIKKGGIMFYLMQSGRGASLISKTRGCQLVQYNQDKITTFDAYKSMGLKEDYRDYRNVKDILIMLNLYKKDFILMTNNPDKIKKLVDLGLKIKETSHLQFPPNSFNSKSSPCNISSSS